MASNTTAYPLARSHKSSVRLNLQHFLQKKDLGWIIHPSIRLDTVGNLKIGDVGTGTGIWLTDLRDELPESATLDGFDVSDEQYPHEAWLPQNVRLSVRDIYTDVPEELKGQYDLINVRFFICVVRNNDPHVILKHIYEMLRPGGYIQWTDYDHVADTTSVVPSVSTAAWDALRAAVEEQTRSGSDRYRWQVEMIDSLEQAGFSEVVAERKYGRKENYASWHQSNLMVSEEMSHSVPGGENIRELIARNLDETPKGVYWNRPQLVWVARKPLK